MSLTDTISHYVYSPVDESYRFVIDVDHDGQPDTMASLDQPPYNSARPRNHDDGANVTLLDGHVERMPFKSLWKVDAKAPPTLIGAFSIRTWG
jgi:prepilin-type processing-associated H-X9-DG protein